LITQRPVFEDPKKKGGLIVVDNAFVKGSFLKLTVRVFIGRK
jgi:predicted O-methyltransferase YrrM